MRSVMRCVSVLSVALLVTAAYSQPVFEDSLDAMSSGWGATATGGFTEGDRTFSRIDGFNSEPTGEGEPTPWYFYAGWTDANPAPLDVSAADRVEFDVRFHQVTPSETMLRLRFIDPSSSPDYVDTPYTTVGVDCPADTWYHVSFDISVLDGIDLSNIMFYEFNGIYAGLEENAGSEWIDVDNLVFTPEPTSLVLLAIGLAGVLRRR